ncbi:hypothetical protein Cadr_000020108 [Camelus dromedarius]|uniref:Uncharacterized protein n=1 Tax=Camelus dromedarius TaxID=9838 RepID=A0A5N4CYF3_CAMDR|nr:hypothetical protein Cadr_000020108 [Camelus dromedarius]
MALEWGCDGETGRDRKDAETGTDKGGSERHLLPSH